MIIFVKSSKKCGDSCNLLNIQYLQKHFFPGRKPAVPADTRFAADAVHSIIFTVSFYLTASAARYMIDIERNMNLEIKRSKKVKGENESKSGVFPAGLFEKTKPICRPLAGNPKHEAPLLLQG